MNKTINLLSPYFSLAFSLVMAVFIAFVPEYNTFFGVLLLLNVIFVFLIGKNFRATSGTIARVLVGLLFMFSGFTKGVDPIGTQYVIHDYLEAYNLPWLLNLTLPASFFLNMLEFSVGFLLVLNVKIRWVVALAGIMMCFFTGTTLYDALANPVPDCGCFGKALILTNWQTFYKNIVIDTVLIGLVFSLPYLKKSFCNKVQYGLIIAVVLLFSGFEVYNFRHLPLVNFLTWKEGRRMLPENPKPKLYYLTYKNKTTGEEKEYRDKEIPFTDTVWLKEWEFVSRRDEDPNPQIAQVSLLSRIDDEDDGFEVTDMVLGQEGYHFIIVSYDLDKANQKGIEKIWKEMAKIDSLSLDYTYVLLTASVSSTAVADMEKFKEKINEPDLEIYFGDDTALKGMIRSNPGVILMKGSTVLKMWNWRDFPNVEQIDKVALDKSIKI